VLGIFAELVGDRAKRLDGLVLAKNTRDAIAEALAGEHGV
jgi:hypothetical protein